MTTFYASIEAMTPAAIDMLAPRLLALGPDATVAMNDAFANGSTPRLPSADMPRDIWVRVDGEQESIVQLLLRLPATIYVERDDFLYQLGDQVPSRSVPDDARLDWQPIERACHVELPVPQIAPRSASRGDNRRMINLIRGGSVLPCECLLTTLDALRTWADTAPQNRLDRLRWVLRADECLVMGSPLPPISGTMLTQRGRIFIPAGMSWMPAVDAEFVAQVFNLAESEWLIWESVSEYSTVASDAWTMLSRGSVRLAIRQRDINAELELPNLDMSEEREFR